MRLCLIRQQEAAPVGDGVWSVTTLRFAEQELPSRFVLHHDRSGTWSRFAYYVFLLQSEGMIGLVDCGIDDLSTLNGPIVSARGRRGAIRPVDGGSVSGLLRQRGITVNDIDFVAVTHLHADHIANIDQFPNALAILSETGWRRHWDVLHRFPQMVPPPTFPSTAIAGLRARAGDRLELADDGPTSIPGVHIRHIGGHTVDSAAFIIETSEGKVVVPGDTIYTYRNLEEFRPVGSYVDLAQCYETLEWAQSAGDITLPCHDPLVADLYPNGIGATR
jgi:glyoxylase-like metal-dependent hydrolase (beta-lactamase superfamily II)